MLRFASLFLLISSLSGCAVVAVADAAVTVTATAVSVGAKTVGLAADAAIGTAKLAGKAMSSSDSASSAKPEAPSEAKADAQAARPGRPAEALPEAQTQAVQGAGQSEVRPLSPSR